MFDLDWSWLQLGGSDRHESRQANSLSAWRNLGEACTYTYAHISVILWTSIFWARTSSFCSTIILHGKNQRVGTPNLKEKLIFLFTSHGIWCADSFDFTRPGFEMFVSDNSVATQRVFFYHLCYSKNGVFIFKKFTLKKISSQEWCSHQSGKYTQHI